jgi:GH18 family chitinase
MNYLITILQGNFKQLYALKLKNRTIKVLLSIGGWTYSQAGHFDFVTSASARATFVNSSIALMEDNGLDGMYVTMWAHFCCEPQLTYSTQCQQ